MKRFSGRPVIAENKADDFVGRESEIERLLQHARGLGSANGLLLLSAPLAGSSELLRQIYDRLFIGQKEIIPVYFAIKKSDTTAGQAGLRFLQEFLVQTVAFRRGDANIIGSSPEMSEISELTVPADGYWIDRLVEILSEGKVKDEQALLRSYLSSPLRAGANGANVFVMIDDLHELSFLENGDAFLEDLKEIFIHADFPFVFAGRRRFLFGTMPFESMMIDRLAFADAGRLADKLSAKFGVPINAQTKDLIAVQLQGNPAFMNFLFAAAQEKAEPLDSFQSVERFYANAVYGGRICKFYDSIFDRIIPETELQTNLLRLFSDVLKDGTNKARIEFWQKHSDLAETQFRSVIKMLNAHEIVTLGSNSIETVAENTALCDYLNGRIRLELDGAARALVVGEELSAFVKRAPQLMARVYRQRSAIGLRELLQAFNGQQITPALIDYGRFKDEFKGANDDKILKATKDANEKISLPRIVYVAHTVAFYRQIGELFDAERSAVALGFAESSENEEIVWIAAEIDSKLEAAGETAEFWCDRLEMVAANCGFQQYKVWLVAPEGFAPDAVAVLRGRNAFGSSRKQVDLLISFLNAKPLIGKNNGAHEYEIIVPMGEDTEMIAAHTVEEIAKRHNFPAKAINQIKTALVEACINAAEHSHSPDRKIYQKFAVDDEKIAITIANRGVRLNDANAREVTSDEGRRGWGLKLMKGLMDDVKIEQTDDGTRITMVKFLKKP